MLRSPAYDQANVLNYNGHDNQSPSYPGPDDPKQLFLSHQISSYRYKRLLKQKELEGLQKIQRAETQEMQARLDNERKAYE
jgi:hypothetical protein